MSIDDVTTDADRKANRYSFDRHTSEYREQFDAITSSSRRTTRGFDVPESCSRGDLRP